MDQQAELVVFFESLSPEERTVFLKSQPQVREFLTRLLAAEGSVFTHQLDRSPGVIGRLVAAGAYTGFVNNTITDGNFLVPAGGIVAVRFRIVSGHELKRPDGGVYRSDVETIHFPRMGLRFGDPDEALLPPAKDQQLGRGNKPYAAFLRGLPGAFIVNEGDDGRYLDRYSFDDHWRPCFDFLGVCE